MPKVFDIVKCKNCKFISSDHDKCKLLGCILDRQSFYNTCPICGAYMFQHNISRSGRFTCNCGYDSGDPIMGEKEPCEQLELFG